MVAMSKQQRVFVWDSMRGGIEPGTDEARAAIAQAGVKLHGERWNPEASRTVNPPGHDRQYVTCVDCGQRCSKRSALRCGPCSELHQRKPLRARYERLRGGG